MVGRGRIGPAQTRPSRSLTAPTRPQLGLAVASLPVTRSSSPLRRSALQARSSPSPPPCHRARGGRSPAPEAGGSSHPAAHAAGPPLGAAAPVIRQLPGGRRLCPSRQPAAALASLHYQQGSMAPPRLPAYLTPEIIEEILLRVSPEDPAGLVRASLACKPWRRLLCDPAFRRRYLAFHRGTPPLLGFLHNRWRGTCRDGDGDDVIPRFVATTTPSPFPKQAFDGCASWFVVDCRHGRVLFEAFNTNRSLILFVWDPTTGKRKQLPKPPTPCSSCAAAVLCALHGHGCDHLDCCSGPFFVVLVESRYLNSVRVHFYSSEADSWNTSPDIGSGFNVNCNRSTLMGNDIYFVSAFGSGDKILRYNLSNNHISFLQAPTADSGFFLVPMEDGLLGLGIILGCTKLCLWSRNVDRDVVARVGWVHCRTIDLLKLISISTFDLEVIGCADDFGIIFVATIDGVFTIDLKSTRARKVGEAMKYFKIFPFMTFYTSDSRLS